MKKLKKSKKTALPKKKKLTTKAKKKATKPIKKNAKKVVKQRKPRKKVTVQILSDSSPPALIETKVDESSLKTVITTPTKRPAKYLNNKDLLAQVILSKKQGAMTKELAKMIMLLVSRYAKKGSFVNYTYNEDMQGYAILMICKTWQGFDPAKSSNPFAWFTQCVKNSFIQYLNSEQRQRDIKDEVLIDNGMNPSFGYAYDLNEEEKSSMVDPVEHEVVDAPTELVKDVDSYDDLPDSEENAPKDAYQ